MHGYCDTDTIVHENGHIGHGAILHGCVVGRDALVGMNSVIMDGAVIGEESIVAAMSFVKAGFQGEARQLLVDHRRAYYARLRTRSCTGNASIPKNIRILRSVVERGYLKRSR